MNKYWKIGALIIMLIIVTVTLASCDSCILLSCRKHVSDQYITLFYLFLFKDTLFTYLINIMDSLTLNS